MHNKPNFMSFKLGFILIFAHAVIFHSSSSVFASSQWITNNYSQVRLLAMHNKNAPVEKRYMVGIYLKMKEGWKTYWRVPGDAGIPPLFDWSGSKNLKNVTVLWPAPIRLVDPYGIAIGYNNEILFPAKLEPIDKAKPIELKVNFQYGVCKDICVPEEANLTAKLNRYFITSPQDKSLINKYVSSVPKQQALAKSSASAEQSGLPAVQNITAVLEGDKPHLLIRAMFPKDAAYKDVFIETSDKFYMDWPKLLGKEELAHFEKMEQMPDDLENVKSTYFHVDLTKGDKAKQLRGKTLTLTLVAGTAQSETRWVVK